MEHLSNGYILQIDEGCFPLSTDSVLLHHFVKLPKNARVLDLGSGCGTLGLLLCAKDEACCVTGIELDEASHNCALENIHRNGLSARMSSLCADLCQYDGRGFDVCVSNPPYFAGGPAAKLTNARREDTCPTESLFVTAGKALKYGGDFYIVHRPERLAQLCACAAKNGMEAKRLQLVRHKEGGAVTLILVQFRKGAKPGLIWEELCLHHADGNPTAEYKTIYHL